MADMPRASAVARICDVAMVRPAAAFAAATDGDDKGEAVDDGRLVTVTIAIGFDEPMELAAVGALVDETGAVVGSAVDDAPTVLAEFEPDAMEPAIEPMPHGMSVPSG